MHLLDVQAAVTNQFSGVQQYGDFVPKSGADSGIGIHVHHIDGAFPRCRQRPQLNQHFLAEAAPRARVQQKARQWRGSSLPL